jgi:hypothetical protein
VVAFALGCALASALLAIFADDPRLLRAAVLAALIAAFAPTLLPTLEQRPTAPVNDELRRLRRELAQMRGELDAYLATGPITLPLGPAPVPGQLPLAPAALHLPSPATNGNGNGHGHSIDLTRADVTAD